MQQGELFPSEINQDSHINETNVVTLMRVHWFKFYCENPDLRSDIDDAVNKVIVRHQLMGLVNRRLAEGPHATASDPGSGKTFFLRRPEACRKCGGESHGWAGLCHKCEQIENGE